MKKLNRGFTLIEVMIVVAIVGLLAALAVPNFLKFQTRSRQSEAKSNLRALFTAERSYYLDKLAYCTALDTIGFSPERGNRYLYTILPGAGSVLNRATATEIPVSAAVTDCGALTAVLDPALFETVGDDQWKWQVPTVAYGAAVTATTTWSPNVAGGITPSGVGVAGAAVGCSTGSCEFVGTAQANIDSDLTLDSWHISSCSGNDTNYGHFAGGEPVNSLNDVNQ